MIFVVHEHYSFSSVVDGIEVKQDYFIVLRALRFFSSLFLFNNFCYHVIYNDCIVINLSHCAINMHMLVAEDPNIVWLTLINNLTC